MTEGWVTIQCFLKIVTFQDLSENHFHLETKIRPRKTWNMYLPEFLDFSGKESELDVFSDFDIVCLETNENGEAREKRFRCHKIVLYLGSNYYKKMFSGNFAESGNSVKYCNFDNSYETSDSIEMVIMVNW